MPLFIKGRRDNMEADQSMRFWGICCESGKQYEQVVGQRFRITMAVLDPKSSSKNGEKTVSLIVIRGGVEYLLCVLKHGEIHQVNLNLIFDKGESVIFYINGFGKVYLSGYQLTDSKNDVLNDENGFLCPLVEVTSPVSKTEHKGKVSKTPQNSATQSVTTKSKKKSVDKNDVVLSDKRKKAARNRYSSEDSSKIEVLELDDDDDDCESDEDYHIGDELESDYDEDETDESYESEDDDEDEEEQEEIVEDEEEQEETLYSKKSQKKRKLTNLSQPQKRSRYDSFCSSTSTVGKTANVCHEDDGSKDSSDSDALNSSIGNTPIPKKQASLEKKKSKKKKRLSEISNLSEKSIKSQKSPVAESTPNLNRTQNAYKKLEGGVEIEDVVMGRGPEARNGKMAHVFYIGRLHNKQIFDARSAGKKPFSFKIGSQQVIKGLDIGIQGMCVGGKRKIKIPPNMGYGSSAIEGIPPNSTLFFTVELQAVS